MPDETKIFVYIVDDDASVRQALELLMISAGMDVMAFESSEDFLEYDFKDQNACLIADVKMRGLGGLDLKKKLIAKGSTLPVIYITAFDEQEIREQAKKFGASGYFRKPVDDQALLDTIRWAVHKQPS